MFVYVYNILYTGNSGTVCNEVLHQGNKVIFSFTHTCEGNRRQIQDKLAVLDTLYLKVLIKKDNTLTFDQPCN